MNEVVTKGLFVFNSTTREGIQQEEKSNCMNGFKSAIFQFFKSAKLDQNANL